MTLTPLPFSLDVLEALPDHGPGVAARRRAAADALVNTAWPTTDAEEWRYSPIDKVDVAAFAPAVEAGSAPGSELAASLTAAGRVAFVDGFVVSSDSDRPALSIEPATADDLGDLPSAAFSLLGAALAPETTVVRVEPGAALDAPIVVSNFVATAGSSFPHLIVDAGADSHFTVVVVHESATVDALTVPRIEVRVGDAAGVSVAEFQRHAQSVTCLGRTTASVGTQGTFTGWTAGLGGGFARHRLDCDLVGRGSSIDYAAAYFGSGVQALDYRVFVEHIGRDTTSNLRFSGVVDDESLAIYTGMIRIHPDAAGSNASQTNRNITLSPEAWAESVPNLEIENNDVHCSHASTVAPVDADQLFYLESRGVPGDVARQLIVAGFFDGVVAAAPTPELADAARLEVQRRLHQDEGTP